MHYWTSHLNLEVSWRCRYMPPQTLGRTPRHGFCINTKCSKAHISNFAIVIALRRGIYVSTIHNVECMYCTKKSRVTLYCIYNQMYSQVIIYDVLVLLVHGWATYISSIATCTRRQSSVLIYSTICTKGRDWLQTMWHNLRKVALKLKQTTIEVCGVRGFDCRSFSRIVAKATNTLVAILGVVVK